MNPALGQVLEQQEALCALIPADDEPHQVPVVWRVEVLNGLSFACIPHKMELASLCALQELLLVNAQLIAALTWLQQDIWHGVRKLVLRQEQLEPVLQGMDESFGGGAECFHVLAKLAQLVARVGVREHLAKVAVPVIQFHVHGQDLRKGNSATVTAKNA